MKKDQIAILDFGSQYTHLICRRLRQLGVQAKIYPPTIDTKTLQRAWGIILSGGPASVNNKAIPFNAAVFKQKVPVLGLCYGHQLITDYFGGKVEHGTNKEYGQAKVSFKEDILLKGLQKSEQVWMSHWDVVTKLPPNFKSLSKDNSAIVNLEDKIWGLQFHPEVHHTPNGLRIFANFIKICGAKKTWNIKSLKNKIIKEIRATAGKKKVFLLVSGGVDSTVAFALLEKALGKDRVYGFHVDNGFMRLDESSKVKKFLAKAGFDDLKVYNGEQRFLKAVKGAIDPEEKRKIIGELFVEIANEEMAKLDIDNYLLGQGTIYPDTIESGGTEHADKIKTHHNRVDLIQEMIDQGKIIEPLKDLYKDEVRELGKELGISKALLERHPFPGPGLAIRALCSNGKDPIKSVGVQGDERSYKEPAIITKLASFKQLNKKSIAITNNSDKVNRVLYLTYPQKLRKLKTHPKTLTKDRLDLLRQADDIVMKFIKREKISKEIWQFPTVLLPLGQKGESLVLRPIESKEAMTVNFYSMKKALLNKLVKELAKLSEIDYIFYDITNKPPGTIEWE